MTSFRLKVQKFDQVSEQICLFELSWGQGLQQAATLSYPSQLSQMYQEWQRAYLRFYKTLEKPGFSVNPDANNPLRGRVVDSGDLLPSPIDWRTKLVHAEATLLNEFHRWLRSAELFEIRSTIAHASRTTPEAASISVFLTCTPLELARLPWEMWELGTDLAVTKTIRIVRTPVTIGRTIAPPRRRRARILAILGDDTGLNFQVDRDAGDREVRKGGCC